MATHLTLVKPGDAVTGVSASHSQSFGRAGRWACRGTVYRHRRIQRAFTPIERQQVIRIEFAEGETPLPLFTKMRLAIRDRAAALGFSGSGE
jgi:hypothetical protein